MDFFFWFLLFVTFVFCVTKPVDQEDLNQLKIPTASSKNFPSRNKTYIAHHKTICNPISPFVGTPMMACAQTQSIKKRGKVEKPSLPLKFLHIWQARNILLQQDRKGQPVCGL